MHVYTYQWRNRRGWGWAECPLTIVTGPRKFLLTYLEKRGKEERENEGKFEREEGKWKMEREKV